MTQTASRWNSVPVFLRSTDRWSRSASKRSVVGRRCWAPRERKWISAYACRTVIMKPETQVMRPEPVEGHADGLQQAQSADIRPESVPGRELLSDHTTLRVGGPAHRMLTVETEPELIAV